jgi:hypothetical protein
MDKRKSIQVSEGCWALLREMALQQRETVGQLVERLTRKAAVGVLAARAVAAESVGVSEPWMREAEQLRADRERSRAPSERSPEECGKAAAREFFSGARPVVNHEAARAYVKEQGLNPEDFPAVCRPSEHSPDARCRCGQKWKDHQGGASRTLAVVTNCRAFQEVG